MQPNRILFFILLIAVFGFAAAQFTWQSQQRQTAQVIDDIHLLEREYSPSFGPSNAKVTLVRIL